MVAGQEWPDGRTTRAARSSSVVQIVSPQHATPAMLHHFHHSQQQPCLRCAAHVHAPSCRVHASTHVCLARVVTAAASASPAAAPAAGGGVVPAKRRAASAAKVDQPPRGGAAAAAQDSSSAISSKHTTSRQARAGRPAAAPAPGGIGQPGGTKRQHQRHEGPQRDQAPGRRSKQQPQQRSSAGRSDASTAGAANAAGASADASGDTDEQQQPAASRASRSRERSSSKERSRTWSSGSRPVRRYHTAHSAQHGDNCKAFADVRLRSFAELAQLLTNHGSTARVNDLVAICSRLKTVECAGGPAGKARMLADVWQLVQPQLQAARARQCAELMLTASKVGSAPDGLYEACCERMVACLKAEEGERDADFPRLLSNAAYALATSADRSVRAASIQMLQHELLPRFLQHAQHTYPQAVANVAYAIALLGDERLRPQLQELLHVTHPSTWEAAKSQELSNLVWSAGVMNVAMDAPALDALLAACFAAAEASKPQHIANSVYGLALMRHRLPDQQVDALADALLAKPPDSHAISTFLWSAAKMGHTLPQAAAEGLAAALLRAPDVASNPQSVSVTLWALATMERTLQPQQLLVLLRLLLRGAPETQAFGNALWACAKMRADVPQQQLKALFSRIAAAVHQAEPQTLANSLWAAANIPPQPFVPRALLGLEQRRSAPRQREQQQSGQESGQEQQSSGQQQQQAPHARQAAAANEPPADVLPVLVSKVGGMRPVELSNVAIALALMGERCMPLLNAVYDTAAALLDGTLATAPAGGPRSRMTLTAATDSSNDSVGGGSGSSSSATAEEFGMQVLVNLCWAGAVLDLRERADQLIGMAKLSTAAWGAAQGVGTSKQTQDRVQLAQLDLWLTHELGAPGLAAHVSPAVLQGCRDALRAISAETRTSQAQQDVFRTALAVPCLQDVRLEAATEDGLMSVDVMAAFDAAGVPGAAGGQAAAVVPGASPAVAIEVDGIFHFRRPDRAPTGPTRFRNRLLASRGFVLVVVPIWEWAALQGQPAKVLWLEAAVLRAVLAQQSQRR